MIKRDIEKVEKFMNFVQSNTTNQPFADFLKWCIEHDMFANVTDEDLEWCYDAKEIDLPLLKNHGITIGAYIYGNNKVMVGIDPSACFNKTSESSIVAVLPLNSKREQVRFYDLLEQIFDKKSAVSKEWFKDASTSWYGEFASFGDYPMI